MGGDRVRLLAIDPGPEESALVVYDTETREPLAWEKMPNEQALMWVGWCAPSWWNVDRLTVEMIASYGMPVGAEVFETCVWIGRFLERWGRDWELVYRLEVKKYICHDGRAKDSNVRQALIDRYGGKEKAIGRKATPGPLYGMTGDCWAALGVAITAAER